MHIEEFREKREILKEELINIAKNFEKETGVKIKNMCVRDVAILPDKHNLAAFVDIEI